MQTVKYYVNEQQGKKVTDLHSSTNLNLFSTAQKLTTCPQSQSGISQGLSLSHYHVTLVSYLLQLEPVYPATLQLLQCLTEWPFSPVYYLLSTDYLVCKLPLFSLPPCLSWSSPFHQLLRHPHLPLVIPQFKSYLPVACSCPNPRGPYSSPVFTLPSPIVQGPKTLRLLTFLSCIPQKFPSMSLNPSFRHCWLSPPSIGPCPEGCLYIPATLRPTLMEA